jgi:hypothetical protein
MLNLKLKEEHQFNDVDYRYGGDGMIAWCNAYVRVPIYPVGSTIATWTALGELPDEINPATGRSYKHIWEEQQVILRRALEMDENGRFKHRLIIFCWPRGEGKSLIACLIQLWKFFCFPAQQIMLGANSRDQVKFVHFDIMRDIIFNSPELFAQIGGDRNIQEKELRLKDDGGHIRSKIRSISSFTGILSNITGYTFSEMFDMKKPDFFVQLDGSTRTVPNALGVIDSTVSAKTHVLYQLYQSYLLKKTRTVYFSYRYSNNGALEDYWNPNMDEDQLEDYRAKFPFGEFERYFLNLWSAGSQQVFSEEMIEEIGILGMDGAILNHDSIYTALKRKTELIEVLGDAKERGFEDGIRETTEKIDSIYTKFEYMDSVYRLQGDFSMSQCASISDLERLGELLDTDWAVCAGMDFGDPYAVRGLARTIMMIIAKGLPGSRSNPYIAVATQADPKYVYTVLHLFNSKEHSLDQIKKELDNANNEFDGIDTLCSERFGAWDIAQWCEERGIQFEPVYPSYDRQRDAFKTVLEVVKEGRFKCPPVAVPGTKSRDVLREEFPVFQHDAEKRWFGSVEKKEKHGVQDDCIFTIGWSLYGGRDLTVDHFRMRKSMVSFGEFAPSRGMMGKY